MVHGDLKGVGDFRKTRFTTSLTERAQPNILINNDKSAILCDFGLASITADAESAHASTVNSAGSIRWMAPERLSIFDGNSEPVPDAIRVTKESDMYSLAMVVIEVRTLPRRLMLSLTPSHRIRYSQDTLRSRTLRTPVSSSSFLNKNVPRNRRGLFSSV